MWKDIEGFEGIYQVSDMGEVRSIDRDELCADGVVYHRRGKIMKQTVCIGRGTVEDRKGYCVVNLRRPGFARVFQVHILVAKAFIPNPNNYPTVNHIDGNKCNNQISNLEWATFSENNSHALRNKLRKSRGNRIAQYTVKGELVSTFPSTCEAARKTGVTHMNIFQCLHGRTKTAGGYVWKHVLEGQTTISQESTSEIDTDGSASHPTYEGEDIVYTDRNAG